MLVRRSSAFLSSARGNTTTCGAWQLNSSFTPPAVGGGAERPGDRRFSHAAFPCVLSCCTKCPAKYAPNHPWPADGVTATVRPRTCPSGGCAATRTTKAHAQGAPRVRSGARTTSRPRSRAYMAMATHMTRANSKSPAQPYHPAACCRLEARRGLPRHAAAGSRSWHDDDKAAMPSQSVTSDQHKRLLWEASSSAAARWRRRSSPRRRRFTSSRSSSNLSW